MSSGVNSKLNDKEYVSLNILNRSRIILDVNINVHVFSSQVKAEIFHDRAT